MKSNRISGFDLARGIAIIGMVIVNFKIVLTYDVASNWYKLLDLISGKAAALFVTLAGVGISLMMKSAESKNDPLEISKVKLNLFKRSVFLFIIGLSYYFIWPADILHYYGIFLLVAILLFNQSNKVSAIIASILILGYPVIINYVDYETGWNIETLEYLDFFTINGFLRNLFINGFHPTIPWLAFLLLGMILGRADLNKKPFRRKIGGVSFGVFLVLQMFSSVLTSGAATEEEAILFGTQPMPPLPFYMLTASAFSIAVIIGCVELAERFKNALLVKGLIASGQLALSNYFFHVVFGMYPLFLIPGAEVNGFSLEFVIIYAILFNSLTVIFSYLWRKKYVRGPLETIMRKVTG